MSFAAMRWAMQRTVSTPGAKMLLVALADHAEKDGACTVSQAALAAASCQSVRSVQIHLDALEAAGLVQVLDQYRQNKSQKSNRYRLLLSEQPAESSHCNTQNLQVEQGNAQNLQVAGEIEGEQCAESAPLVPTVLEPEETTTPPTPPMGGEGEVRKKRPARRWPSKRTPRSKRRPLDPFEVAWRLYPKRAGGNSKAEARKAWRARLRSGVRAEDLTAGVQRYAAFVRGTGKEHTVYVKQAASFFGPAEHWTEDWTLPKNGNGTRPRPPTIFATPEEVRRSTPPPARPVKSRMMVEHEERQRRAAGGER
jgi:hypothetical protein